MFYNKMSQIPPSLLFFTSQISGLSRNNVQIQSQSATELATDGTNMVRFALPSASIVDMASFVIRAKCSTQGVAATTDGQGASQNNAVGALMPSGGLNAMIARTAFSCGGVSLSNDVNYADVIKRCKANMEDSFSKCVSDKRVMEAYEIRGYDTTRNPFTEDNGQERVCVASNLLGFAECHPRYFDCSLVPQLFVNVTLAGRQAIPVQYQTGATTYADVGETPAGFANTGFTGTQCQFRAKDLKASIDVISIGSGLYAEMLQSLMAERGSLTCVFPSYNTFSATTTAKGEVRGALSVSNLHKLYTVARISEDGVAGGKWNGAYYEAQDAWSKQQAPVRMRDNVGIGAVQAAHSFTGIGQQYWRYRVNNAPFPLWNVDSMDAYVAMANGEDRLRKSQPGCQVTSLSGWQGSQYVIPNRFSLDNDPRKLSGLNLAALSASITLNTEDDTSDAAAVAASEVQRQAIMIAESYSRLQIGAGRAISLTH
jgi:hypothetical protein